MGFKVFGQLVSASDIERLSHDDGPTHFVRVCGALMRWALVEHGAPSADIQIAERLTVPDRGVDAECTLPDSTLETGGFIGPGRTVFQFKFRDVGAADRRSIVNALVSRLRQELSRLPVDSDRYVLMTNVNLAGAQVSRLRKAIVDGAPALAMKPVVVWGAAEIANALNASPGLRHLFAAAGGLSTVEVAEAELKASYGRVGWAPFMNRVRELSILSDFIESDDARVLVIRGPQFSGRTRLVLEAVKRSAPMALWAVAAEHVDVDLLRDLDSSSRNQILVVDDDRDDNETRRILDWAEQRQRLKTIVITRGEAHDPDTSDPVVLHVPRMETEDIEKLLHSLAPGLPFGDRSWIVDGADGLPGLAAHAAAHVPSPLLRARVDPEEFRRKLAHVLTVRYESRLSPAERDALKVASVLRIVGVEGSVDFEIAAVAKALDVDSNAFTAHRLGLERAGLLRRRGRFVEVVPPLLADHLATQALTNPERVISELEFALGSGKRFLLLLDRLARLPGDNVRRAVDRLLREKCADFNRMLSNAEILRILAPVSRWTAITCIEDALRETSAEALATTLKGEARRALVWTLEDLTHWSQTFQGAAGQLLVLAEAESEDFDNSATGVFSSLFHWGHPELPVSLSQRLAVLEHGAAAGAVRRRQIVASAIGAAFKEHGAIGLHHPRGPRLPEPPWRPTRDEVGDYARGAIEILRRLLDDADAPVRAAAAASMTHVFGPVIRVSLGLPGAPEGDPSELALKAFEALAEVERSAERAATYQAVATALELVMESLRAAAPGRPYVQEITRRAKVMHADLVKSFRGRLWRVIGPVSWDQRRHWRPGTRERQDAIQEIAAEFLNDSNSPALFESHMDWLMGSEARSGGELFHALGASDTRRGLWECLLAVKPAASAGEGHLSAYLRGWAERDPEGASIEADRLIASRPDLTRVLLGTLATLFRGREIVDRVGRLLASGAVERYEFAALLASAMPWGELEAPDVETLLGRVDDGTPRVRQELLWALDNRLLRGGELSEVLRERAWSFLDASSLDEAPPRLWWDQLAAHLGASEPQRLLTLIDKLVRRAAEDRLERIGWYRELPLTFTTLRTSDRSGLIRTLLRLASHFESRWRIGEAVEEEINPVVDQETLLAFARETGVEGARTVALNLTAEKPGFWEITRDLLAEWGNDDRVRERLLSDLYGRGWEGSALPMIKERLDKATALRSDPSPWVASWAQEAVSFFESWRRREARDEQEDWIWDYRIRRAELEGMVRGPESPDKLWAIGRLLEHAPRERVLELLTPEEILEALGKLPQLPERVREHWEAWAKHWAGRH